MYRKCLSESCREVFADLAATKGCDIDTMIDEVNKRTDEKNRMKYHDQKQITPQAITQSGRNIQREQIQYS